MVLEPVEYTWEDRSKTRVPAHGYRHEGAPGLVVGKDISGYYSVTHAPSGRIASPRFSELPEAARYLMRLAPLCNWTEFRPETEMSKALEPLVRAMEAEHYAAEDVTETKAALEEAQREYEKRLSEHEAAKMKLEYETLVYRDREAGRS